MAATFRNITLPDKNAVPSKDDLPPIYEGILQGIMNGEIKETDDLPLMRKENSDGSVDMKIPESMMPMVMFVARLNGKAEE